LGVGQVLHRVELLGQRERCGISFADLAEQRLGLLLQVVEVRVVRKISGRHGDLLSTCLLSASSGEKGGEP
jgi:hypothetical protein